MAAVSVLGTTVAVLFKMLLASKDRTIERQDELIDALTDTLKGANVVLDKQSDVAREAVRRR